MSAATTSSNTSSSTRSRRRPVYDDVPSSSASAGLEGSKEDEHAVPPTQDPNLWLPQFDSYSHNRSPPTFEYEIPRPNGNHWQNVLDPLMRNDKERCDGWKDEVQNLLIFAGLFSAIVTAFLIESYQTLKLDPQDTAVAILMYIAVRLDASNQTAAAPATSLTPFPSLDSPFTPSPSLIRINILWFISLILSLTVVLVGTVCLQWLREHQTYENASPKEIYALYRMREEALRAWRVPAFFTALPLLLEASLVFFFVGLALFLWDIQRTVATWVIAAIGVPLIFLLLTTSLPALQLLTLYDTRCQLNIAIPAYCPYKSPQSRIFRQLISQFEPSVKVWSWGFTQLYLIFLKYPITVARLCQLSCSKHLGELLEARRCMKLYYLVYTKVKQATNALHVAIRAILGIFPKWHVQDPTFKERCAFLNQYLLPFALKSFRSRSWTDSDKIFLELRTTYDRTLLYPQRHRQYNPEIHDYSSPLMESPLVESPLVEPPLYDQVRGLRSILTQADPSRSMILSAYHCFREVSLANWTDQKYLGCLLTRLDHGAGEPLDEDLDAFRQASNNYLYGMVERNTVLFLDNLRKHHVVGGTQWYMPEIHRHVEEMAIRLIAHGIVSDTRVPMTYWTRIYPLNFDPYFSSSSSWYRNVPAGVEEDSFGMQYVLLMKFFFQLAANNDEYQQSSLQFNPPSASFLTSHFACAAGAILIGSQEGLAFRRLLELFAEISDRLGVPEMEREIVPGESATSINNDWNAEATAHRHPGPFNTVFWCTSLFLANLILFIYWEPESVQALLHSQPIFRTWLIWKERNHATETNFLTRFSFTLPSDCFNRIEEFAKNGVLFPGPVGDRLGRRVVTMKK